MLNDSVFGTDDLSDKSIPYTESLIFFYVTQIYILLQDQNQSHITMTTDPTPRAAVGVPAEPEVGLTASGLTTMAVTAVTGCSNEIRTRPSRPPLLPMRPRIHLPT